MRSRTIVGISAYASVVTLRPIGAGETFTNENLWVKRPGTGEILAPDFEKVVGRKATVDLGADVQLRWGHVRT